MKTRVVLLSVALAMAGLSCGNAQPANSQSNATADGKQPLNGPESPAAAGKAAVSAGRTEGDVPPVGARFHLFCDSVQGPSHATRASQLKKQLIQLTGLDGWHIIHSDSESSIYFGYYRTISKDDSVNDPREVARAQADLRRMNALTNAQGEKLFRSALFQPISGADPTAPPQWNLANAPADAFWSLQIGAYRGEPGHPGDPSRKELAIESVRALREAGIEAYYFHGETVSSVCIGAWPESAIKKQQSDASIAPQDLEVRQMIVAGRLPDNIDTNKIKDREGHDVVLQAPKLEVLHPGMADAIRKFPYHAINGAVYGTKKAGGGEIPDSSFLVFVPHEHAATDPLVRSTGSGRHERDSAVDQAAADAILSPDPIVPTPNRGRLRSLDQP